MNKTAISIVIVSYNNPGIIDDCLRSIRENNDIGSRLEVIVVEQSPGEELYRDLAEHYPEITVIRAENRGFGAGNNRGAELASGDLLLFLNPDTVIEEPLFRFVEERFRENLRLGLAGVRLLSAEGENISYDMQFPYGLAAKLEYVLLRKADWFLPHRMFIGGADLMLRREAFEKAGGFDDAIFMYGEETDLCRRVMSAGYEVRYFREKRIRHLQGKSTPDRYPAVFGKQLDSFLYLCRKDGLNASKWLKREVRYQRIRAMLLRAAGRKEQAELAAELGSIAAERMERSWEGI